MRRDWLRRSVLAMSACCLVLGFTVARAAAAEKETLVVGMELAYPPFEMTDTSGTLTSSRMVLKSTGNS